MSWTQKIGLHGMKVDKESTKKSSESEKKVPGKIDTGVAVDPQISGLAAGEEILGVQYLGKINGKKAYAIRTPEGEAHRAALSGMPDTVVSKPIEPEPSMPPPGTIHATGYGPGGSYKSLTMIGGEGTGKPWTRRSDIGPGEDAPIVRSEPDINPQASVAKGAMPFRPGSTQPLPGSQPPKPDVHQAINALGMAPLEAQSLRALVLSPEAQRKLGLNRLVLETTIKRAAETGSRDDLDLLLSFLDRKNAPAGFSVGSPLSQRSARAIEAEIQRLGQSQNPKDRQRAADLMVKLRSAAAAEEARNKRLGTTIGARSDLADKRFGYQTELGEQRFGHQQGLAAQKYGYQTELGEQAQQDRIELTEYKNRMKMAYEEMKSSMPLAQATLFAKQADAIVDNFKDVMPEDLQNDQFVDSVIIPAVAAVGGSPALLKFVLSALGVQSVANRRSTANADREYGLALNNYALRLKAEGRATDQATFDKKMAQARLATQVFESLARSLSSSGHGNKAKGLDLQSFIRLRQQVKDRMVEEATRRDPNDPWATKPMPTEQEINDAVETEVKQSRSLLENSPEGQALMNSTQFGSLGERDEAVVRMKIALFLRMAGKPSDMGSVTQVLQNPGMLVEILNGIEEYEFGPVR